MVQESQAFQNKRAFEQYIVKFDIYIGLFDYIHIVQGDSPFFNAGTDKKKGGKRGNGETFELLFCITRKKKYRLFFLVAYIKKEPKYVPVSPFPPFQNE